MPIDRINRESDNNADRQGKNGLGVDFTRNIIEQQESKKSATDKYEYSSKIFGLKYRQEMKGGRRTEMLTEHKRSTRGGADSTVDMDRLDN